MGFFSTILNSSALMWLFAFVFVVFCIRCLLYGIMGGTSTILRIVGTLVFAGIAYYCYQRAMALNGPNAIDNFVYDSLRYCRHLLSRIKSWF